MMGYLASVVGVSSCDFKVSDTPWNFARDHAAAIDAHWANRRRTHPAFFNGVIYVMADLGVGAPTPGAAFAATLIATDFKSFLYWRETGHPQADVLDAFGSAILRSREGHVLLGRQSVGNINGGFAYLPGGFIDARDVGADGIVDIGASVARELAEETGLSSDELSVEPGFLVTRCGSQVSVAREYRSPLASPELRALILSRIAADPNPELADIVIVRSMTDLEGARVLPYTALALEQLFSRGAR